jgi:alpha-tubulin suppressor-like RCC1 family protein
VPTEVVPGRAWTQISVDTFHSCGIDAEQNLYCAGRGIEGQLGTGDNTERLAPELIGKGFAQVAVGRMSTCAVASDGAVLCTGENAAGQLGLADSTRRNVFTALAFP